MDTPRKPPATVRMERRDVVRGIRLTESEDKSLRESAVLERMEFSAYLRLCLFDGHKMRQASRLVEAAGV